MLSTKVSVWMPIQLWWHILAFLQPQPYRRLKLQSWRYRVRRGLLVASRIELRLDYSGSTILVTIAAILRSATNATNHKFGKRHENTGSMQHACSLQLLRISIPNED